MRSDNAMSTANPALRSGTFDSWGISRQDSMTIDGTVTKTAICLVLLLVGAMPPWSAVLSGDPRSMGAWLGFGLVAGIVALVLGIVLAFKRQWSPVIVPVYALLEGLAIGGLSGFFEVQYPGIAIEAAGLTFGTLACLLLLYQTRLIQVTDQFRMIVFAATGGIMLMYLVTFILGLVGAPMGFMHGNGLISIIISLVIVGVAALNLVLDFDTIERGAAEGAPKYMEWYGAFALLVTLVWLYIEMLRLLSKLRSRD